MESNSSTEKDDAGDGAALCSVAVNVNLFIWSFNLIRDTVGGLLHRNFLVS